MKAALNIAGMRAFMGILICFRPLSQSRQIAVVMMMVVIVVFVVFVVFVVVMMIVMRMIMVVMVVIMLRGGEPVSLTLPCPPEHPGCGAQNNKRGNQLQPGLHRFCGKRPTDVHATEGDQPDHGGMGERCRQSQHHRLLNGSFNGDDKCCHHRFRVTGFQSMQHAEKNRAGNEKPRVTLLKKC